MKMIVGLGNPGQKYVGTRHNIGFEIIGELARSRLASPPKSKFEAEYSEVQIGGEKVILLCPLTYMNLSGRSVSQAAGFFKVDATEIIVVCDDFNLDLERIRFRPSGSAGGQNGLDDIIKRLGTRDFPRLRVGIGPVPTRWKPADFVLGKFTEEEIGRIKPVIGRCVQALEVWVNSGIGLCMNRYNAATDSKSVESKSVESKPVDSKPEEKNVAGLEKTDQSGESDQTRHSENR